VLVSTIVAVRTFSSVSWRTEVLLPWRRAPVKNSRSGGRQPRKLGCWQLTVWQTAQPSDWWQPTAEPGDWEGLLRYMRVEWVRFCTTLVRSRTTALPVLRQNSHEWWIYSANNFGFICGWTLGINHAEKLQETVAHSYELVRTRIL